MYLLVLLTLLSAQINAPVSNSLSLSIQAPPELTAVRDRLQSVDVRRFAEIEQLVGTTDSGPEIQVELVTENSAVARQVQPWISGFAVPPSDLVVIFPARSPGYPNDSLEDVLRHEVAHVLIWRAAGGRSVPRWFDEGLAMATERERRFQDQTQLFYQLAGGSRTSLNDLNRLFSSGQNEQVRAYALAGAIVHEVLERYGPRSIGEILKRMSRGEDFDDAFRAATGSTLDNFEGEFWRRQRIWTVWVPILGSSTTLWLVVTVLAMLAIYMRRRRNVEIEKRWEEEGDEDKP